MRLVLRMSTGAALRIIVRRPESIGQISTSISESGINWANISENLSTSWNQLVMTLILW